MVEFALFLLFNDNTWKRYRVIIAYTIVEKDELNVQNDGTSMAIDEKKKVYCAKCTKRKNGRKQI